MSSADNSLPPNGPTLKKALTQTVAVLEARSIRYAIIGGIATIQHGRVRTTNDVDILLNVPQIGMPALFEALQEAGFAADPQVNTVELRDDGLTTVAFGDVLVDLMRPVLPVYAHVLDRAVPADIFGKRVLVSSAECLIVTKLISFRPQDEADIADLVVAYAGSLDAKFIKTEFATVAAPDDPRWVILEDWLK